MTIRELRKRAVELETATTEPLRAASEEFHGQGYRPHDKNWLAAWSKLTFWTDARNGFRQAEDALHALEMMEKGGEWN